MSRVRGVVAVVVLPLQLTPGPVRLCRLPRPARVCDHLMSTGTADVPVVPGPARPHRPGPARPPRRRVDLHRAHAAPARRRRRAHRARRRHRRRAGRLPGAAAPRRDRPASAASPSWSRPPSCSAWPGWCCSATATPACPAGPSGAPPRGRSPRRTRSSWPAASPSSPTPRAPTPLVHDDEQGIYGHPDHRATSRIGATAAELVGATGYRMTVDREHLHVSARDRHLVHGAARAAAVPSAG